MSSKLQLDYNSYIVRISALAFLVVALIGLALPQMTASTYKDPGGRYVINLPKGWNPTQLSADAVQFAAGTAYLTVMVLPSSDSKLMLNSIATQTGRQWKNFKEERRGGARLGGLQGESVTYSGLNPQGSDSNLGLLAASDGSLTYLVMISAGKAEFARQQSAVAEIEASFSLANAAVLTQRPAPGKEVSNANYYRLKLVRIVDERGFERPMTALTALIPEDWQFQGSAQYGQALGCHANLVKLVFRAVSPDGKFGIELLPGNTWQWSDDANARNLMQMNNQQMAQFGARGCDILAPLSADAFVRQFVLPTYRTGARIANSEPMDDATRALEAEAKVIEQVTARQGIQAAIRTDASRVRINYSAAGAPVEEWVMAMTSSLAMLGPTINPFTGAMGQTRYYTNTADHVLAMRAPQGGLDSQAKLFDFIRGSIRTDPQWEGRVRQVMENMAAQDAKGASDRSRIATQSSQDISRLIREAYQNSSTVREHSMEGWAQYMRGVQTYKNERTGETVELSNQYEHAWVGPNNTYLVTDSPGFNPNSTLDGSWTPLERTNR